MSANFRQTPAMKTLILASLLLLVPASSLADRAPRTEICLNGSWEFEQTHDAFPPARFTRTITVPGLIHLARPRIDQYHVFIQRPDTVRNVVEHDLRQRDYTPMYSWYRRRIIIPKEYEGREAVITILKSQYVTQVYVNGFDVGSSMACYTPIDLSITSALKFGRENEILIRVGDRAWLPSQAAGSTDKEKIHYLPGIWDNVSIAFTGPLHILRTLLLPTLADGKLTAKVRLRSLYPPQLLYGTPMFDTCTVSVEVREKTTGKLVASRQTTMAAKRDNLTDVTLEIPLPGAHPWSPDDPFLYKATVSVEQSGTLSDRVTRQFGMRDFVRKGKFFYLNGKRILLRGTNITLQRFFEDPDCSDLAWNHDWVRTLLANYPKRLHWNAMRLCVGIAPSFWYDIADSCGLLFQNEWFYWQNHGWDQEIRDEYTDWVWADGSHPSIAIWDAINENWDPFIGNILIPELKKLDPTRIWDAGYMTGTDMQMDEMDEPHPYRAAWQLMTVPDIDQYLAEHPFPLGKLDSVGDELKGPIQSKSAQLVNEYGWIWLWRDGRPAKLTVRHYGYFVGDSASASERRELQAYWLELETEWLRCERSLAGVLAFCYLTNNYGFTGDWFTGEIKDLHPGPTLAWFKQAFAPAAVFIDLPDQRYLKNDRPYAPGSSLQVNLIGVNDLDQAAEGTVTWRLLNAEGREEASKGRADANIPPYGRQTIPALVKLPIAPGGYLLLAEFHPKSRPDAESVLSRRYIRVGDQTTRCRFYEMTPPAW